MNTSGSFHSLYGWHRIFTIELQNNNAKTSVPQQPRF